MQVQFTECKNPKQSEKKKDCLELFGEFHPAIRRRHPIPIQSGNNVQFDTQCTRLKRLCGANDAISVQDKNT